MDFQICRDAKSSCGIWLCGKRGIGKTVLTSTVIKYLDELYNESSRGAMAYYSCSGSESSRAGVLDILMDILTQLASTKAGWRIFQDWKRNHSSNALTRIEIHKLILRMVELNGENQTTIIIDGLDEIDKDSCMRRVASMQYLL